MTALYCYSLGGVEADRGEVEGDGSGVREVARGEGRRVLREEGRGRDERRPDQLSTRQHGSR